MDIGYPVREDGTDNIGPTDWPGHLVGMIENHQDGRPLLVDPTAQQLNRVEFGIAITPVVYLLPSANLGAEIKLYAPNGSELSYVCLPEDRSYEDSELWSRVDHRTNVRDQILRVMSEEALAR